jgi:hypothetical protein
VQHRQPKFAARRPVAAGKAGLLVLAAGLLAACEAPKPVQRTYFEFMEDDIAREGVLARCNLDRDATSSDVECVNARRAAATLAFQEDRVRREQLERESQRKLLAMRARVAREAEAQADEEAAAREASKQAYERRWPGDGNAVVGDEPGATAAFGAPLGPVLPSIAESSFDFHPEPKEAAEPQPELAPPSEDSPADAPEHDVAELALTLPASTEPGADVVN